MKHLRRFLHPATVLLFSVAVFSVVPKAHAQSYDQKLFGGHAQDFFGHSIDAGKDLDGDGVPDFVVGAPTDQATQTGRVEVYSGASRTLLYTLYGANSGDEFGESVAMIGDLDGDGKADLLVGAIRPGYAGYVKAYKGTNGSLLYTITGNGCDYFGNSVKAIGDINGDGVEDFAVAAPRNTRQTTDCQSLAKGAVFVYSGLNGSLIFSASGAAFGDTLGSAIEGVGDVDADGKPDIAVAANGLSPYTRVYSGASHSLLYTLSTLVINHGMNQITKAGDINGDGKADFVLGNGKKVVGSATYESVQLISGANGSVIRELAETDSSVGGGHAVINIGDMNGDGVPDFLASSLMNTFPSLPRSVRILSGADFTVMNTLYGSVSFDDSFGASLARIGDTNADGKAEYIIGSMNDKNVYQNEGSITSFGLRPDFTGFKLIRKGGITPKTVIVPSN